MIFVLCMKVLITLPINWGWNFLEFLLIYDPWFLSILQHRLTKWHKLELFTCISNYSVKLRQFWIQLWTSIWYFWWRKVLFNPYLGGALLLHLLNNLKLRQNIQIVTWVLSKLHLQIKKFVILIFFLKLFLVLWQWSIILIGRFSATNLIWLGARSTHFDVCSDNNKYYNHSRIL